MAVSTNSGSLLWVSSKRALRIGVYITARDLWKLQYMDTWLPWRGKARLVASQDCEASSANGAVVEIISAKDCNIPGPVLDPGTQRRMNEA